MFEINEGTLDRIIRVVIGVALLALAFSGVIGGTWQVVVAVVAFVPLLTGVFGFCPLYRLVGLNTCPRDAGPQGRGGSAAQ